MKPIIPVTKKEELWALSLLKKHYIEQFPEIGKYLHKTNIKPTVYPEELSDEIQYEYNHNQKRAIFSIIRTLSGLWIWMTPQGDRSPIDQLHTKNLQQQNLTTLRAKDNGLVSESVDPSPVLTKKQELYALDIIKKQLLPKDLEAFNNNFSNIKSWYKSLYPQNPELQPLTLEQALKIIHKKWQGDFAMYVISGPEGFPSLHYVIDKNTNGSISIYYEETIQKRSGEIVITL